MTGTSIKSILAFALLVGLASQANADIWGHIDRQASDIKYAAEQLRTEVDHYRHTRYYGQLIGATARLKGQAINVHNIAEHSHSEVALKYAVKELNRAFHDVEQLFDRVEHSASLGDGRVRGNTAHVKKLLNSVADCIHNLGNDVAQLNRAQSTYKKRVDVYRLPTKPVYNGRRYSGKKAGVYNQPRYRGTGYNRSARSGSGFGLSIGGGSSRITFNF